MKLIIPFFAMAFLGFSAVAQTAPAPASQAETNLALELIRVSQVDQTLDLSLKTMTGPMMDGMMRQMLADPKTKAVLDANPDLPGRLGRVLSEQLKIVMDRIKPKMLAQMPKLYTSVYSKQEMTDILSFYKTTSGQSMLQKMPQTSAASGKMIMDLLIPELGTMRSDVKTAIQNEMKNVKIPDQK
jgi:hypothetical protein